MVSSFKGNFNDNQAHCCIKIDVILSNNLAHSTIVTKQGVSICMQFFIKADEDPWLKISVIFVIIVLHAILLLNVTCIIFIMYHNNHRSSGLLIASHLSSPIYHNVRSFVGHS